MDITKKKIIRGLIGISFLFFIFSKKSFGNNYERKVIIPSKIKFADMHLEITSRAKELIQKKIDNLIRDEKAFNVLLNRALLYMPVIEKNLKDREIPLDFKYVPIQESAMISTADDSYSRGFWQFKNYTAKEVKIEMDSDVDAREHIIESTKGAAKYLKANNIYCRNWLVTLLAYNRGRGWVEQNGYKQYRDHKKMKINHETHWYIIHFIAHKLVFEEHLKNKRHPSLYIHEHINKNGDSLAEIAKQYNISHSHLLQYNTWLKNEKNIFLKRNISIIIPLENKNQKFLPNNESEQKRKSSKIDYEAYVNVAISYPELHYDKKSNNKRAYIVNGIKGTIALVGDSIDSLCDIGRLQRSRFIIYNDIEENHKLIPGRPYYFAKKSLRGDIHIHIAQRGETWWSISQKYGVLCSALLKYNRELKKGYNTEVSPGRVVFLRSISPKNFDSKY